MGWNGGVVEIHQVMWLVMLKYAKDRILGVDTLGQQVLPRVRYGSAMVIRSGPHGARGPWYHVLPRETLAML
jgi:hypothetical protein